MKFTYGFTTKNIRGKRYVYFWNYTGTGRKTEVYIGREGKPETEKKALQVELEYLLGLQLELAAKISKIQTNLKELI